MSNAFSKREHVRATKRSVRFLFYTAVFAVSACASGPSDDSQNTPPTTTSETTPACGNSTVDPGEQCDTGIEQGKPGACPNACDDDNACTLDTLLDKGFCSAKCKYELKSNCENGDGDLPIVQRAWDEPHNVKADWNTEYVWETQSAIDDAGNVFVVWRENIWIGDEYASQIFARRYDNKTRAWGVPQKLTDAVIRRNKGPDQLLISVDDEGNASVAWLQRNWWTDGYLVQVRRYDPATKNWGGTATISNLLPETANQPYVALGRNGTVATAFFDSVPGRLNVRYLESGDEWQTLQLSDVHVDSEATSYVWHTRAVVDAAGHVFVTWLEKQDSLSKASEVRLVRYDRKSKTWSNVETLGQQYGVADWSVYGNVNIEPSLVTNRNGDVLLAWWELPHIRARFYNTGKGKWSELYDVADVGGYVFDGALGHAPELQLTLDSAGRAFAAWGVVRPSTYSAEDGAIYVAGFVPEKDVWDDAIPVAKLRDVYVADTPKMHGPSMDEHGNATLAWVQADVRVSDRTRGRMWVAHFDVATSSWGQPAVQVVPDEGVVKNPQAVMNANGDLSLIWRQRTAEPLSGGGRLISSDFWAMHYRPVQ